MQWNVFVHNRYSRWLHHNLVMRKSIVQTPIVWGAVSARHQNNVGWLYILSNKLVYESVTWLTFWCGICNWNNTARTYLLSRKIKKNFVGDPTEGQPDIGRCRKQICMCIYLYILNEREWERQAVTRIDGPKGIYATAAALYAQNSFVGD